ncbi:aminopeptidase P N-terminal domain-containing protein, partial [Bordetella pertussis]
MSLPPDDIAPFAARRRRLMDHMRAAGGGIAILPTAPQALRNRDAEYPYRHDSDFFYLTGFTEPEAWLVLVAGATDRALLFCRDKHPEHEIWEGFRFGPEAAAARFGFDDAHGIGTLDELVPALLLDQPALWTPVAASAALDERVRSWLAAARAQGRSGRL